MAGSLNPALTAFVAEIKTELILAQIIIRPKERGFEIRHVSDLSTPEVQLQKIPLTEVRALADYTAARQFRPLKSSPNLRTGWILFAENESVLELSVNQLYPNAIPDWFAITNGKGQVTDYREFTARQTGMYRIATMLNNTQAAQVIRACCHKNFCLKQRLWSVEGLTTDTPAAKSLIPCLEPCAIMLEFARKGMRIEQEEKVTVSLSPSDAASLKAAAESAIQHPIGRIREADFNAPENPRRLQLALEKVNSLGIALANTSEGE